MSMFGGDNELGNMLQEAVKLKTCQMNQKRKTYETWPFFVQHTLYHAEKGEFSAQRQLPFDEKMEISERIKDEGNKIYASGNWSDAVDKYEEAATLVHYCYSTDPEWRKNNRGIDDDVLVLVEDFGSTEEDKQQQRKLRLQCCLNLAACKQKMEKYEEAIVACDTALELDDKNVKALYRRAEARVRPAKSTAYDHDLAIKDLAKAHEADPKNSAVEKLLTQLRADRKVQRAKDSKTFTGMFDRGQLYKKEELEQFLKPNANDEEMKQIQSRIDSITDDDPLEKRIEDAEMLRELYMRNGKEDEAHDLNEKIKGAKKAMREREEPKRTGPDWDNLTPEMIEDAKKWNLDLTDPMVLEELKRLEHEGYPDDDAEKSSGPYDLPLPEADGSADVPWMRYVWLFAVMVVVWRLLDAGVLRWTFGLVWHRVLRIPRVLGLSSGNADVDDDRGSLFATAYRKISAALGAEVDDGEL